MASKPQKNDKSTYVFATSEETYRSVVKATAKRQTASPALKAFVAQAKSLINAH